MRIPLLVLACVVLLAGTVAFRYGTRAIAARYDQNVSGRGLEMQKWLKAAYDRKWLEDWTANHPDDAAGYASPILLPLDLLFALFASALFGLLSVIALTL